MEFIFLCKITPQVFRQTPRRQSSTVRRMDKRMHVDILFYRDHKRSRAGRQPPPPFAFDQHSRRAVNKYRGDITRAPHRDGSRSPFQSNPSIGGRSRALGENYEIAPATHSGNAIVDDLDSIIIVANISCGTDRSMSKGVAPKRALHNTI